MRCSQSRPRSARRRRWAERGPRASSRAISSAPCMRARAHTDLPFDHHPLHIHTLSPQPADLASPFLSFTRDRKRLACQREVGAVAAGSRLSRSHLQIYLSSRPGGGIVTARSGRTCDITRVGLLEVAVRNQVPKHQNFLRASPPTNRRQSPARFPTRSTRASVWLVVGVHQQREISASDRGNGDWAASLEPMGTTLR